MGRRNLGPSALRITTGPRFTEAEFVALRAAAETAGRAPATWLRELALRALNLSPLAHEGPAASRSDAA